MMIIFKLFFNSMKLLDTLDINNIHKYIHYIDQVGVYIIDNLHMFNQSIEHKNNDENWIWDGDWNYWNWDDEIMKEEEEEEEEEEESNNNFHQPIHNTTIIDNTNYTTISLNETTAATMFYTYKNHMNSITMINDSKGNIVGRRDYTYYGKRRPIINFNDTRLSSLYIPLYHITYINETKTDNSSSKTAYTSPCSSINFNQTRCILAQYSQISLINHGYKNYKELWNIDLYLSKYGQLYDANYHYILNNRTKKDI